MNIEERKIYMKNRYYANHEENKRKRREWNATDRGKEIRKAERKRYREKHREKINERDKKWSQSIAGVTNRKKWVAENMEKRRENRRLYDIERRKNDPQYKLLTNIRTNINRAIKDNFKYGKAVDLIGCPIIKLHAHLEKQFLPGMTWENYGEWHIDHIIPCAAFDLSFPNQQKECFNYKNLRPLWAIDNLKKHAKLGRPFQPSLAMAL